MKNAKQPEEASFSTISSRVNSIGSALPNFSYLIFLSARTRTSRILRFAPRTICATSPLTGDVSFTASSSLLKSRGEPALTSSPSFTTNLNRAPWKSSGFIATVSTRISGANSILVSPTSLMSTPRLIFITSDMYEFSIWSFIG